MEVKNYLYSVEEMSELSRKTIFPIYTTALEINAIEKELKKGR